MLYQLSYFRFFLRFFRAISALDFARKNCGRRWIRTTEGINQQIYSLPHLATLVFSRFFVSFGRFLRRTSHPRSSQPPGCYVVRRLSFLDSSRNILQNLVFCGLLRWTSHPRSVIYISKLLPSSLVRLEARRNNSKIFQKTEPMEGIEPTTPRLQITCSSQLSYIGETLINPE